MASFTASTAWSQLQAEALSGGVVQGFGNAAAQLMNRHLEG